MTNEEIEKILGITPPETFEGLLSYLKNIRVLMAPEITSYLGIILNTLESTLIGLEHKIKNDIRLEQNRSNQSITRYCTIKGNLDSIIPHLDSLSTTVELVIAGMKAKVGWEIGDDHD